jgi:serpin B
MLRDDQVKDSDVKMLLINALAIDMEWLKEFQSDNTTSRPFTKANGEKVDVAMMHKTSETNKFYQDEEYSVLSMPFKSYDDTNLEFITIMPNEKNLKEVLTSDNMNSTITTLLEKIHEPNNQELSISIPRFDFEYKTSLKEDLMKMGIKEAFEYTADFSNISDTGLRVDDILHKANIKCSEKGVKAAAVTVVIMKDNAIAFEPEQKEKIYLNFNKPFMFIIRDTKTNETWFVGTVYEPFLWENVKDDYEYR